MEHEGRMARDEEFAGWYQTYYPRIRSLCARILRDPVAAEDIAQEALLRAWTRHDELRQEDLGAWLSVVARNLCVSAMRRDGRLVPIAKVPERSDPAVDPAQAAGLGETRSHLRQALAKLGDRHRRAVVMREVREVGYKEIGSELGVTAQGARSIAFRARRVLREHLIAAGEDFSGMLLGFRVRLQNSFARVRPAKATEPVLAQLIQAGLAIAMTSGMVLGGASSTTNAALDSHLARNMSARVSIRSLIDTARPDAIVNAVERVEFTMWEGTSGISALPPPPKLTVTHRCKGALRPHCDRVVTVVEQAQPDVGSGPDVISPDASACSGVRRLDARTC